MRPRINTFGKILRKDLDDYFFNNKVYGFTANKKDSIIIYTYLMMFRSNKKEPEMLYIEVSRSSKLVLKAWLDTGKEFKNVEELKEYTKK